MKKGITPIIAVIILLLITVALAGFAWSFLSGYMGSLTGKNVQVADSYCINGNQAKIVMKNVGTDSINLGAAGACSDPTGVNWPIIGTEFTCGDLTIVRTDGGSMNGNLSITGSAASQASFTFTDNTCATPPTSKICTYRLRAGSSGFGPNIISVSCSG